MPGGDRTGPLGQGAMTGRGAGYCTGYTNQFGRGFGGGFARGRGMRFRNWNGVATPNIPYPYPTQQVTPENEIEMLKNQAKFMQDDMTAVNKRIKELEKKQ